MLYWCYIAWLFYLLFFDVIPLKAQDNVGLRLFGLSIHPYGEERNAHLMPLKLDDKAYFVQNLGGILSCEKFMIKDILSAKVAVGMYMDCAAQFGGFAHLGVRGRIFSIQRHKLYGGIGPTFIFRQNWLHLDGYHDGKLFRGSKQDKYQCLFLWYGGEFEYRYEMSSRVDGVVSLVPGYPDLVSVSIGFNYKL